VKACLPYLQRSDHVQQMCALHRTSTAPLCPGKFGDKNQGCHAVFCFGSKGRYASCHAWSPPLKSPDVLEAVASKILRQTGAPSEARNGLDVQRVCLADWMRDDLSEIHSSYSSAACRRVDGVPVHSSAEPIAASGSGLCSNFLSTSSETSTGPAPLIRLFCCDVLRGTLG
jgi:hypothetical protein